jgi:hypothetical protein
MPDLMWQQVAHLTFINYRQDDTGPEARLIAEALCKFLPPDAVFLDTVTIDYGDVWPERIRSALSKSRYVLVVMGPDWLRAGMDEWGQRKIDKKADWVRQEIATALKDNNKTIIPLLVRNAKMPPPEVLPSDIAAIAARQFIVLRRDYWDHDIKLLTSTICPDAGPFRVTRLIASNPLISSFWDNLSPSLQDAFSLAANDARRQGKDIISTRTLFAALRQLHPDPLPDFFDQIPSDALPEPVAPEVATDPDALSEIRQFSSCVQNSLDQLTSKSRIGNKLNVEELFVDIARNGTGASVRRLRTHGIDISRIDEIVRQLGWSVSRRA